MVVDFGVEPNYTNAFEPPEIMASGYNIKLNVKISHNKLHCFQLQFVTKQRGRAMLGVKIYSMKFLCQGELHP